MVSSRVIPAGAPAMSERCSQYAANVPSPPPPTTHSVVSTISCPIRAAGVAPSAAQTEISRARSVPRTSRRIATLRQPTRNRRTAAATNSPITGLTSPTTASFSDTTRLRAFCGELGGAAERSCVSNADASSLACARVAVAFRRPSRVNHPSCKTSGAAMSGCQTSAPFGNAKPLGATPTIVAACPFRRIR